MFGFNFENKISLNKNLIVDCNDCHRLKLCFDIELPHKKSSHTQNMMDVIRGNQPNLLS